MLLYNNAKRPIIERHI